MYSLDPKHRHCAREGFFRATCEAISVPSFEVETVRLPTMADLAKAGSPERSCSDEIVSLGQEESSFDRARDSHSSRRDCVGYYRAAGANRSD